MAEGLPAPSGRSAAHAESAATAAHSRAGCRRSLHAAPACRRTRHMRTQHPADMHSQLGLHRHVHMPGNTLTAAKTCNSTSKTHLLHMVGGQSCARAAATNPGCSDWVQTCTGLHVRTQACLVEPTCCATISHTGWQPGQTLHAPGKQGVCGCCLGDALLDTLHMSSCLGKGSLQPPQQLTIRRCLLMALLSCLDNTVRTQGK